MKDIENFKLFTVKLTKGKKNELGFLTDHRCNNSVVISNITHGSTAQKQGQLKINDEIIAVNKTDVKNDIETLRRQLTLLKSGEAVELTIRRRILLEYGQSNIDLDVYSKDQSLEDKKKKDTPKSTVTTYNVEENGIANGHCARKEKPCTVKNLLNGSEATDTLHLNALKSHCTATRCLGSILMPSGTTGSNKQQPGEMRPKEELKIQAIDFMKQYYASMKCENSENHLQRVAKVVKQINETGTYDIEAKELIFGAHLAWRNAPRCIGRIQWKNLQVFDCRHVTTAREMFECCLQHLKFATNKGKLRSAITVFPKRKERMKDFRVWSSQLIKYAGYKNEDGTITGDPASIEFTEIAQRLGWEGDGTHFDVLPLILQANGEPPELFEIPKEYILEVNITHPKYPEFETLGLKWYALPAVANMALDCGGLQFTAAPFNGWYMATEIAARNFGDTNRYNLLKPVAALLGFDTSNDSTLWKDRAMLEMTLATLYSYNEASVTIVDHHTASDSFCKHLKDEAKLRGGCPADWVWIVPPMSGSAATVFHQEMLNYHLKPSYEYQVNPWKYFPIPGDGAVGPRRKIMFKPVAHAVRFATMLMDKAMEKRNKVTILYATETGKSETFAKILDKLFLHAFHSKVMSMEEYNFSDIENEQCVLIVTSTFGNGEAPDNGQLFGQRLHDMLYPGSDSASGSTNHYPDLESSGQSIYAFEKLANLRYSIFALGSRAYPRFCAFGHSLNKLIKKLGGEEFHIMGEGDEMCGQEDSFKNWARGCFEAACGSFCVTDVAISAATISMSKSSTEWTEGMFRIIKENDGDNQEVLWKALSKVHRRNILPMEVISVQNLQAPQSGRITNLVRFNTRNQEDLLYKPGDHLSIYPENNATLVENVLSRVNCEFDIDELINVERKVKEPSSSDSKWKSIDTIPMPSTLRRIFTSFLDITTPPSSKLLSLFVEHCTDEQQQGNLKELVTDTNIYEEWKYSNYPSILEVLQEFSSIKVEASMLINQLPVLKPRHYSISSSLHSHPNEVHATVALVQYTVNAGHQHNGVCSSWLNSLLPGDLVSCNLKKAPSFRLPNEKNVPVIMVGPGTGIAPFRSFWQQQNYDIIHNNITKQKREMILFFGCRNSSMDNIYMNEIRDALSTGALSKVYTAYSREENMPKIYVQHLLKKNLGEVCDLLVSKNGHFYVCGDVNMASDICKTVTSMIKDYSAFSDEEAQTYINRMRNSGRYHEDIFGVTMKIKEVTTKIQKAVKRSTDKNRQHHKA